MYFTGWFTADGTDGQWGEEISSPYINNSGTIVNLYARFNNQERKDGSELFPWTLDDTKWSPYAIKGIVGEKTWIKYPCKKGFAALYINGIKLYYIYGIPFASEEYNLDFEEISSNTIASLTSVEADFNNLKIRLVYYNDRAGVMNAPDTIPVD